MITAVCNIFINSDFKLELFKQTFPRVYGISDNWLINIRGKHREDVVKYIRENFSDSNKNCIFFSRLDDGNWAKSSRKMLESSKYEHVYVFLEDHFLLKSIDHFKDVIRDMVDAKIECFAYSFFDIGLSVRSAEGLDPDYSKHFYSFQLSNDMLGYLKKANRNFYPYSLASVCSKKHFERLLRVEDKLLVKVPFFIQVAMENIFFMYPRNRRFWSQLNRLLAPLRLRFVIYPPASPFNLERSLFDIEEELLPLRIGGLKEELFANWDDDNGLSNSSLVKRGLYPLSLRAGKKDESYVEIAGKEHSLGRGAIEEKQFYPEMNRVSDIPLKEFFVRSGTMRVFSGKESYTLKEGATILVHANIPHRIEALEDLVYSAKILWKKL